MISPSSSVAVGSFLRLPISSFISSVASSPSPLFSPSFLCRLAVAVHGRRTPPTPALISLFFFLSVTSLSSLFLSQATDYLTVAKCLLRRPSPQLPSISSSPCFSLPAPPTSSSPSSSPSTASSSRASLLRSGKALGFFCRRSLTASTTHLRCPLFLVPAFAVAILHRRDPNAVALSSSTAANLLGFSVVCRSRSRGLFRRESSLPPASPRLSLHILLRYRIPSSSPHPCRRLLLLPCRLPPPSLAPLSQDPAPPPLLLISVLRRCCRRTFGRPPPPLSLSLSLSPLPWPSSAVAFVRLQHHRPFLLPPSTQVSSKPLFSVAWLDWLGRGR